MLPATIWVKPPTAMSHVIERDNVELRALGARHQPDHGGHQKAGGDGAKDHLPTS